MVATAGPNSTTKRVKLFKNGASQAVRLPADFRFDGVNEIFATRDNETGEITLSITQPKVEGWWDEFLELLEQVDPNDPEVMNYMNERPLNKQFKWRSVLDIEDEEEPVKATE